MDSNRYIEKVPEWALCAIINGDCTGLNDDEIAMIENWLSGNQYGICVPIESEEAYFTSVPAFGLPCTVRDCICIKT